MTTRVRWLAVTWLARGLLRDWFLLDEFLMYVPDPPRDADLSTI